MHYVSRQQMHALEYLVYHVHPFGYDQNSTEKLPRKLFLDEIISRSDVKSYAPEYYEHERFDDLDNFELEFKKIYFLEFTILKIQNDIEERTLWNK